MKYTFAIRAVSPPNGFISPVDMQVGKDYLHSTTNVETIEPG